LSAKACWRDRRHRPSPAGEHAGAAAGGNCQGQMRRSLTRDVCRLPAAGAPAGGHHQGQARAATRAVRRRRQADERLGFGLPVRFVAFGLFWQSDQVQALAQQVDFVRITERVVQFHFRGADAIPRPWEPADQEGAQMPKGAWHRGYATGCEGPLLLDKFHRAAAVCKSGIGSENGRRLA
jgi:hypothetical protein